MTLPYLLSTLIFLPLLAGLLLLLFGEKDAGFSRGAALSVAVTNWLISLLMFAGARDEFANWIQPLGIHYYLHADGLSFWLIQLTTWLTPLAIWASWNLIKENAKIYYGCMLLLSGGMLGVLASMDLFLFYVFWEVMLIPAFFLVGMFGGAGRRPATFKFVIYTMVGSLFMLVGIVYVGYAHFAATGAWSFSLPDLYSTPMALDAARWAFVTFLLAFGVKAALFPLHTWLPDAYFEAPAPVTFMLSAVMAKLALYGFLRVAEPLFPEATHFFQPLLISLAVTGIIYAALIALVQDDAKRVVAYASISHLGVILLAVFTASQQAVAGAVLHMVAHALTTGALFLLVGFLYERKGTTQIKAFGGLAAVMPVFAAVAMLVTLASVGLPGLTGFVGEFLIFLGTFDAHKAASAIATISVILGAAYMLWMYQRSFFGPVSHPENKLMPDLSMREGFIFLPLIALIIGIGVAPQGLLDRINPAVVTYLNYLNVKPTASLVAPVSAETSALPVAQAAAKEGL